jgi:1-acyl-sn-glycerol-3-phosphate acyltransferase
VAVAGYLVSRRIPPTPAVAPDLRINWNPFTETWRNLRFAHGNRVVWLSMLGISWFWFYGATFLTQFANFTKDVLGGDEHVATLLLAIFSVGIGVGSLLCERLSGRKVELGLVPFGSIGLSLFAIDLYFASRGLEGHSLRGVGYFLAAPAHWRIVADLILLGMFGGFYIVPLYALIQERSEAAYRSRIIAANNILNAIFMVASAGLALGLLKAGLTIPQLFLMTGLMNAVVALYIYLLVPEFLMRFLAWILIHTFYRVDKEGLEHIPAEGPCVIVCNHVSFVDAVVIAACVPRPIRFVMDHRIFSLPVLNFIFRTMRTIPIAPAREDPTMKERAFEDAAKALKAGEIVCIFPEGAITSTGELQRFRPGLHASSSRPGAGGTYGAAWTLGQFLQSGFDGKAMRRLRGVFSRIALVAGAPMAPRTRHLKFCSKSYWPFGAIGAELHKGESYVGGRTRYQALVGGAYDGAMGVLGAAAGLVAGTMAGSWKKRLQQRVSDLEARVQALLVQPAAGTVVPLPAIADVAPSAASVRDNVAPTTPSMAAQPAIATEIPAPVAVPLAVRKGGRGAGVATATRTAALIHR